MVIRNDKLPLITKYKKVNPLKDKLNFEDNSAIFNGLTSYNNVIDTPL